ncbi:MAG: trypsin-like peptidase domain-containing protein [Deinococcaceae bacterium]
MRTLVKGQRIKLSDIDLQTSLNLDINLQGPSKRPFLLAIWANASDQPLRESMAFYPTHASSASIAWKNSKNHTTRLEVDLEKRPTDGQKLTIALAFEDRNLQYAENARTLHSGYLSLSDAQTERARFDFSHSDFGLEKTLILAELYLKDGQWRLSINGHGFTEGIEGYFKRLQLPLETLPSLATPTEAHRPSSSDLPDQKETVFSPLHLPQTWPGNVQPRVPSGLLSAVGTVVVRLPEEKNAMGTGFCVTPGGHLLTCHHVIEEAQEILFRFEGTNNFRKARLIESNEHHDLALLWLEDSMGHPHWLPLNQNDAPELGDELGLLGYPLTGTLGDGVSYSQGIINGIRSREGISFLQIDTGAAPGSSGGPIFNRISGQVIGMLHGGFSMGDRGMIINLGIDIRNVWTLGWANA